MVLIIAKTIVASLTISFCSWLSGRRPELAGFIIALPITTLLVLSFSYLEFSDPEKSISFAKSIFVGIPITLLFFVPFLLAGKTNLSFWMNYGIGAALLIVGYFIHKSVISIL